MSWVGHDNVALFTDLYELTMVQAYWRLDMRAEATFSLFSRRLPRERNYLIACGLDDALDALERFHFSSESLDFLASQPLFEREFVDWLGELRFTGSVHALPEGTPLFGEEPLLEVTAPLPEAQIVESLLMNQVHLQTVLASKAARVVEAAQGRRVVDFGMRRAHGADAALKGARAFYVAGVAATSNVLAGQVYGIPIAGTMAHSYVQAHDSELAAFRDFAALYPETVLLVDTYDTAEGVQNVIRLARELGSAFRVTGIRLDSGDLAALARQSRDALDAAGLEEVGIFASGGLDEHEVARLVEEAPEIGGFGVGTRMSVASDAPALDMAYKATAYAGKGRLKLSPGKRILPGRKQIFRLEDDEGQPVGDTIAREHERLPGRPLLTEVMRDGRRLSSHVTDLDAIRENAARAIERLPPALRGLTPAETPYRVEVSGALVLYQREVAESVASGA